MNTNEFDTLLSENKKLRSELAVVMEEYHAVVMKKPSQLSVDKAITRIYRHKYMDRNN